ncbi:MAG: N-6 DNA methylase [Bifidobacteriaceae bacterium]|jgi:type I restriction enzyme M protein|nr:N-6 DNA methylase [Bifidobacteriaceae bacterium]
MSEPLLAQPTVVPPGKVLDFIDGTVRDYTPEEYVRQEILKSLVREYGYPPQSIEVERSIKFGARSARVDIAIFRDGLDAAQHSQESVAIIVECKKPGTSPRDKKAGVDQLVSYMAACPNADLGMWTNGTDLQVKHAHRGEEGWEAVDIPDLPRHGQRADLNRPSFDQLRPAASDSLLFAFRRAHDYIAGNQGLQKPEAFWELLKLIFCKIHDERSSPEPQFYATPAERGNAAGQMRAKRRIGALFGAVKESYPQIFRPAEEVELQPGVLAFVVTQLQMFSLLTSDVDVKGKAYEEVVGSNLRGDRGEFFTPRNVCQMMVEMTDPQEADLVLDPACGTGGFLVCAMNHVIDAIRSEVRSSRRPRDAEDQVIRDRARQFLESRIVGLDFNPSLVRATKMNMVMNNDGSGGLFQANSLAPGATWPDDLRARDLFGAVDVILTNPPFGAKIPIDDPATLAQYDLGHMWSYDPGTDKWLRDDRVTSRPPEILFIERCVQLLKPGQGRAAIVLPDGILGSPGLGFVRQWLLERTILLASVDMHPDTFQPFTSVQTSVLLIQRKSDAQLAVEASTGPVQDYEVFMAVCDRIGHDKRGNATYVRDDQGYELIAETTEAVTETARGRAGRHTTQARVRDDNTRQIAQAFRAWLGATP